MSNEKDYTIGSSQALSVHSATETAGLARFTAIAWDDSGFHGKSPKDEHSVEVKVTFDPVSKSWTAEVVRQWQGRF